MTERPSRLGLVKADLRWYGSRRRWASLLRVLFSTLILGEYGERCQECGRAYLCWFAPAPLWAELMPSYGGLLCLSCFDAKAAASSIRLRWTPMVVERDGIPTMNWWCDETRDALLMGEPDPDYFPDEKVRQPQPTWAALKPLVTPDLPSPYPAENRVPS